MIENELDVPPVLGDAYSDTSLDRVPETLDEAIDLFEQSEITNSYLGEDFVRFYAHSRRLETLRFQAAIADGANPDEVTTWELARYFEMVQNSFLWVRKKTGQTLDLLLPQVCINRFEVITWLYTLTLLPLSEGAHHRHHGR